MTRKKFIKKLMALGAQRNTAAMAAAVAAGYKNSLSQTAEALAAVRAVFFIPSSKRLNAIFNSTLLDACKQEMKELRSRQALRKQIRPLSSRRKTRHNGYRVRYAFIDEMHLYGVNTAETQGGACNE